MKIEAVTDNSFYILLTDEDMQTLGITFEELDYSNIETRRIIWTLLEDARSALGRDIDPRERMLIEVTRVSTGCKIKFTIGRSGATRYKIKRESNLVCGFFKSFGSLCGFFESQKKAVCKAENAELFSYKNGYALILTSPADAIRLRLLLSEYASLLPVGEIRLNEIREHGSLIFRGKPHLLSL
jgi:negative regulator of genetic competence, sporulation and motility